MTLYYCNEPSAWIGNCFV